MKNLVGQIKSILVKIVKLVKVGGSEGRGPSNVDVLTYHHRVPK